MRIVQLSKSLCKLTPGKLRDILKNGHLTSLTSKKYSEHKFCPKSFEYTELGRQAGAQNSIKHLHSCLICTHASPTTLNGKANTQSNVTRSRYTTSLLCQLEQQKDILRWLGQHKNIYISLLILKGHSEVSYIFQMAKCETFSNLWVANSKATFWVFTKYKT